MKTTTPENFLRQLTKAVQNGQLTQAQADAEVFAEMETGDPDAATETLYFNFTRGISCN